MTQTVLPETGTGQTRDLQPADLAFRALLASSVVAAICVSPSGNVLSANAFLLRLLRLESLQKLRELDFKSQVLVNAADWQHWERARATSRIAEQELALRATDGRKLLLEGDIWSVATEDGKGDFPVCEALPPAEAPIDEGLRYQFPPALRAEQQGA